MKTMLTPLEITLIAGFGTFFTAIVSIVITSWIKNKRFLLVVSRVECQQLRTTCGLQKTLPMEEALNKLCKESAVHGRLLRLLAEKSGLNQKEMMELERDQL
jgi:hypothetical protein